MNVFVPAQPFPPGEYIQDELEARTWTIDDLADVTGISTRQLKNLIHAKSGITPDSAKALADAFGQDAQTWMNLQAAYELAIHAQEERDVARKSRLYTKAPIRELKRRGWISDTNDVDVLERDLCTLLNIPSISDQPNLSVAARKASYDADTAAQVVWYCRCRQLAKGVGAVRYSDELWKPCVEKLLALSEHAENVRLVPKVLAECGIRLVLVQHLRHTKIDGVALWLDESAPVIAMSLRYDRIDNFWFTLMHEMIHVKYREQSPVDVDICAPSDDLPSMEVRANQEAANCLIPSAKIESLIQRIHPHYSQTRIVQFAQTRKVHPGVVVGQLHGRGQLKYNQLRQLLVKVREHIFGNALTDGWKNSLGDE
jgi:HTH-type transcriptional regulator/antitoxin HigA